MNSSRSWLSLLAPASGLLLLGAFGCSHEQKAPPAHPAPPPWRPGSRRAPTPPEPPPEAPSEAPTGRQGRAGDLLRLRLVHPALGRALGAAEGRQHVEGAERRACEIDGNCDELGTIEYNLALGEERAKAAKTYLDHLGVPNAKVRTVSYGSERPKYPGHDDDAHAKNRRDDLIVR